MGKVCEAMIDIADQLGLEFETEADFQRIAKVADYRRRLHSVASRCNSLRQVTRLWNWIDYQEDSDYLFEILLLWCPWAFHDPTDVNLIRFTY